jgi:TonB family protein
MTSRRSVATASFLLAGSFLTCAIGATTPAYGQRDAPISDKETKLVASAKLEYPTLARTALIQGVVVVRATLDEKGAVLDTAALSGAEALIPACLDNARKWRFKPNSRKEVIVVYNFRIAQEAPKPACGHFKVEPPNFATITACAPEIK